MSVYDCTRIYHKALCPTSSFLGAVNDLMGACSISADSSGFPRHQAAWPLKVRVRGSGSITAHHTCKIELYGIIMNSIRMHFLNIFT